MEQQQAHPNDAATRPATLTPIKDRGDGSPSAEAREQARQIRKQRNARVEAWRDIVVATASDCTCIGSSPPSSFVDSTTSWGAGASGASNATTGELPGAQEPADSPATTVSACKQDGPGSAAPQCLHCSRLGAPSFMGEKEVDEFANVPQPRRTSSISRMLKQFTARIGLGDRRTSTKRPTPSAMPRGVGQAAAANPPASRDSFVESRKTKMKQIHRDRQRHEQRNNGDKRSMLGGKTSLDLNQVNEALLTQPPACQPESLTYRRAGHGVTKSASSPPPQLRDDGTQKGKQMRDSLSLSTNEEDVAVDPLATQRLKQASRGIERMARAQQLLNRVKDLSKPGGEETLSSRAPANGGKGGGPMARRAAPPVQAPA